MVLFIYSVISENNSLSWKVGGAACELRFCYGSSFVGRKSRQIVTEMNFIINEGSQWAG